MIKNVTKYIHCFKMLQFKSINIKKVKVTLCKRRTTYHTDSAVEPKLFFTFPFQVARQFALRTPPTGLDHRQQVKKL